MKYIALFTLIFSFNALSQHVWERNEQLKCVQTKTTADDIRDNLKKQHGKDCDYLRDSTRVVIGHFFKCPDEKIYPYFRSKEACEGFFKEGKKVLETFAPASAKDKKKWVKNFGECMEKATPGQYTKMGPQDLNVFCYCVAEKTKTKVNGFVVKECSKRI